MASDKPADVQYLIDAVGLPLQKGLAEVLFKMPQDPVEYLATWLYAYCGVSQAVRQEQQEELIKIAKANAKENEKFESELLVLEKDQVHADEASIAANASQKHSQEEHHAANAERVAEVEPSKHVEEAAADGQQTSDNIFDLGTDRTGELHNGATHRTETEAENIEPNADQDAIEQPVVADGEAEASASHEAQPDENNQAADEEKPHEAETAREHVEPTHDAEPAEADALHTARSQHPAEEDHAHETTRSEVAETLHGDPPAEEAVHTEHEAEQHQDAAPNQEQSHNLDAQSTDEAPLETQRSEQPADEQAHETARSDQAAEETHSEHVADEPQATERSEPPAENEKPQSDSEEAPAADDTQETARSNEPEEEQE